MLRVQLLAAAAAAVCTAATAAPDRGSLVMDALRAATGCGARAQVVALDVNGTHRGDGLDGSFEELLDARDGRYATAWRSGDLTSGDGFDGVAPWERDFSATTHVMDAPSAVARAKTEAWLRSSGWCDARSAVVTYAGTASGAATDVVRVQPRGGAKATLYVDRTTHLLDRSELRYDENHEITYYEDWREAGEASFPFRVRIVDPEDRDEEVRTIRSVRVLASVAASRFAPPPTAENVETNAPAISVPYVVDGYKPIVDLTINGKGPFPFVVDTGGHFILTAQTAETLGLSGRGSIASVNQHAVHRVGFTRIARLQIGGATILNQVAEINPYGFSKLERGPRPPKAGWLGLEFFERFAVTFDPGARTMTLRPLTAPRPAATGIELPMIFDEDSPLTACAIARRRGTCMLDTGNAGETIASGIWAQRSGAAAALRRGIDIDGEYVSRVPVSIGPFQRPGALVSYDPVGSPDAELFDVEAAVLNFALIDGFKATFDYGKRGLWLQPAGPYVPQPFNRTGVMASKRPDGKFVVRGVIDGSPAAAAGMRSGDRIAAVDGTPASQMSGGDFSIYNASPPHATVTYRIERGASQRRVTIVPRNLLPH